MKWIDWIKSRKFLFVLSSYGFLAMLKGKIGKGPFFKVQSDELIVCLECRWNPPKYDCCTIEKLGNDEYDWVDIGYDKKDLKGFTGRRLKTCYHFSLPTIENFRVSYYGGEYLDHGYWTTNYWGGEFIQMKLDNHSIIQVNLCQKLFFLPNMFFPGLS